MSAYVGPALSDEQRAEAARAAARMTNGRSLAQIRAAVILLCGENIRLATEINEHRVARGLAPLPLYHP